MKLMASLAPARAEFEAGAVAKADQQFFKILRCQFQHQHPTSRKRIAHFMANTNMLKIRVHDSVSVLKIQNHARYYYILFNISNMLIG